MVAALVNFSDITKLVRLADQNKDLELLDYIVTSLQVRYSFESLNPVLKALFYANCGKKEKKILNKWMHLWTGLKEYGFYTPFYHNCFDFNDRGFEHAKIQEGIVNSFPPFANFCDIKGQNLKTTIPHIIHNVWILSSTAQDPDLQIATFNKHNEFLKNNYDMTKEWEHYVWLPHPNAVTVALQNRIIEDNYTIRYISELADTDQGAFLVSSALTFAECGYYSFTSDFLRMLILNKHGGVYLDGDYQLYSNIDKLVDNFSSVTGKQNPIDGQCTAFIAMAPQHLLTQTAIDLVIRNFNFTNAPEYVKYPCSKPGKLLATDVALGISRALINHKQLLDNQTDLFLDSGIISDYDPSQYLPRPDFNNATYKSYGENCPGSFMEEEIGIIGKHAFHGSWKAELYERLDYSV